MELKQKKRQNQAVVEIGAVFFNVNHTDEETEQQSLFVWSVKLMGKIWPIFMQESSQNTFVAICNSL